MTYPHCQLTNGDLISKRKVDEAFEIIERLNNGFTLVELPEEELFSKGDEFEAVHAYWNKHNCTVLEAREAIKNLRK